MLRQIFQTTPYDYLTFDTYTGTFPGNIFYGNNPFPFVESFLGGLALWVATVPNPNSENCIFLIVKLNTTYYPSFAIRLYQFDSGTGACIGNVPMPSNIGALFGTQVIRTRLGAFYQGTLFGGALNKFVINDTADVNPAALSDPERSNMDPFTFTGDTIPNIFGLPSLDGQIAIDETTDTFIFGSFQFLSIFRLSTGALQYTIEMPNQIGKVCLEDSNHVYVLCSNRVLVLVDYVAGATLGAVKLNKSNSGQAYWNSNILIAWDWLYRRLLVFDPIPDSPAGFNQTRIQGYRYVPIPVRLTTPIPLKVPRTGRTIPVLTWVQGDMNEGVGGYIVRSVVTGAGFAVGIPITDNQGRSLTQVFCSGDEGEMASPPSSPPGVIGGVDFTASITMAAAPDIPATGVATPPPIPPVTPGPPPPPGTPTPPGGSGLGTHDNPIIPMSADPATIAADVRASLAFYGRTDDAYWIGVAGHLSNGYSDHLWRIGWSRYWEVRADPTNSGSANIALANLPAIHHP